jgi:hypothetical protein
MGRIIEQISISNPLDNDILLTCNAFVDTGAALTVLPSAWKNKLGKLNKISDMDFELGNQEIIKGEIYGPVLIEMEGFRGVYTEIAFIDMHPINGIYEPVIGYTLLELAAAAVDMVGHRLIAVKKLDFK